MLFYTERFLCLSFLITKCSCKNDFFKIRFDYVPRKGTNDFSSVELVSQCTECDKTKRFGQVDIDYSPSAQLFENAITFCKQPKIKYKTYSINGYWKKEDLYGLINFLSQKKSYSSKNEKLNNFSFLFISKKKKIKIKKQHIN